MSHQRPWKIAGRFLPLSLLSAVLACSATSGGTQAPEPMPAPAAPAQPAAPAPAPAGLPDLGQFYGLDTVRAGAFDNGKMWTFEYAPLQYFGETYGFSPDSAWFAHARLGALRLSNCTASFVSPNGLVLTNHHCAREAVTQVTKEGERLLDNGFYATSLEGERPAEGAIADQLIAIVDVSAEVDAALAGVTGDAERAEALEAAQDEIAARIAEGYGGEAASIVAEVTPLWNGAKYSAYVFKRYTDLRLVAAPELQLGFFGGDPDNFTYPRYDLDFSFFRIYGADGKPLKPDHYFTWSQGGVEEGDAVFVIGNPGSTSRLQTMAELEYRRAVGDKAVVNLLSSRVAVMEAFRVAHPEEAEQLDMVNTIFNFQNSEKAYRGQWEGLFNPLYMARRADSERQFRAALEANPDLSAKYAGLFERMAEIQRQKTALGPQFGAFAGLGSPDLSPATLLRALMAYQYRLGQERGAPASALEGIKGRLLSLGNKPAMLEEGLLAARLRDIQKSFGAESDIVRQALGGRTPEAAAQAILAGSALADSARAAAALESGTLSADDPALQLVNAIIGPYRDMQMQLQQVIAQEEAVAFQLGRARFDVYGTKIPPDATFSLRIADGVVKGYRYNGTLAPPYTTFHGMFDRNASFGPGSPWELPARWLSLPAGFDRATPLNFALTADVVGGNSGSPVINTKLEVVGVIFDGNIESLPGDYIYDPERNRAVAVDVRGILEALDDMYDADRLVLELTTGRLVATEAEADRARSRR